MGAYRSVTVLDKLSQVEELIVGKHLPGRHPQQRHAGAGGGGSVSVSLSTGAYVSLRDANLSKSDLHDMFSVPGVTSDVVVSVSQLRGGAKVEVSFSDANGNEIGNASRTFVRNPDGKLNALNANLELSSQNTGIGSELYSNQIAVLKERGYDAIYLTADISIGKYAWARKGFEYDDPVGRPKEASVGFQGWAENKGIGEPPGGWPTFKSAKEVADYDIPGTRLRGSDIVNVGVMSDASMHVGKAFMLDDWSNGGHGDWEGRLDLQ